MSIELQIAGSLPPERGIDFKVRNTLRFARGGYYQYFPVVKKTGRLGDHFDFEYAERCRKHCFLSTVFFDADRIFTREDFNAHLNFYMYGTVGMFIDHNTEKMIWDKIRKRLYFEIEGDPLQELEDLYKEKG